MCIYKQTYTHIVYNTYYMLTDNPDDGKTLLGTLDYAWLFSYAVAMFFRYACELYI